MTIPSISGGGPNDTRQSQIVWEWVRTFYEPNLFAKIEFTEGLEIESICLHLYVITFSSAPATAIFLLHERLETCKFSQKMWRFFSENGSAKTQERFFLRWLCLSTYYFVGISAGNFWIWITSWFPALGASKFIIGEILTIYSRWFDINLIQNRSPYCSTNQRTLAFKVSKQNQFWRGNSISTKWKTCLGSQEMTLNVF